MIVSIYRLKPAFINFLRPMARYLVTRGCTANHITMLAALLSFVYGTLLCLFPGLWPLWLGLPLWFFARMALNAIDGIMAREFGQKSRLGALLNEGCDVSADAALYLPLAFVPGVWGGLVALFIWLALLTEYAGTLGLLVGSPRRYEGPMGKSDRAFIISLGALIIAASLFWGFAPALAINIKLGAASALMLPTVYHRCRVALLYAGDGK